MDPSSPSTQARRRVGEAVRDAVVGGLDTYGPHVVGLCLFLVPVCAAEAFAVFALGVPAWPTTGAAATTLAVATWHRYRKPRGRE